MKEFEVYIQNHDFSSVRYNYKSTMNFMDIREVPKDLRVPYLGRTRKSAVRDIKLIHYNFHNFTEYKYKYFTGVLEVPFYNERTNYIFFNVTTLNSIPQEVLILNTFNSYLVDELYFNKLKYAYETLTIGKQDPDDPNIVHFPKLEKDINKDKEPLKYIFESYGNRVDFDSLELPVWEEDEYNWTSWDRASRDGFIRSSLVLNMMADIFIQLGIDPKRRIKKEVIKLNNRCKKHYKPEETKELPKYNNEVPAFDPNKDYSNPITDKLKGVNHPGFKVFS